MGWFTKAKASGHFGVLRGAIGEKLKLRTATGAEEAFEVADDLWRKLMEENGHRALSLRPFSMSYTIWAALPECSPDQRADILADMIALILIPNFKETKFAHELENTLPPIEITYQRDGAVAMDESFRKLNPRSYASIFAEYGQGPFARLETNAKKGEKRGVPRTGT